MCGGLAAIRRLHTLGLSAVLFLTSFCARRLSGLPLQAKSASPVVYYVRGMCFGLGAARSAGQRAAPSALTASHLELVADEVPEPLPDRDELPDPLLLPLLPLVPDVLPLVPDGELEPDLAGDRDPDLAIAGAETVA